MLFQDDEKDHVIIGEAALHLALTGREISIITLVAELGRMAVNVSSDARLVKLSKARSRLKTFITPGHAEQPVPYLQTIAGLNEENN